MYFIVDDYRSIKDIRFLTIRTTLINANALAQVNLQFYFRIFPNLSSERINSIVATGHRLKQGLIIRLYSFSELLLGLLTIVPWENGKIYLL